MQKEIKNWTQHFEQFSQVINDQQAILTLNTITFVKIKQEVVFRLVQLFLYIVSFFI